MVRICRIDCVRIIAPDPQVRPADFGVKMFSTGYLPEKKRKLALVILDPS